MPKQIGPAARGKSATIYTVAQRAGVSHQTVSRYLRGESLRPHNRERVERALASLEYQVNDAARDLATNHIRRIGALVFDVDDWAPQRVLAGAGAAAREAGHVLDIVRVDPAVAASIDDAIAMMNRTALAGVLVLSPSDPVLERIDLARLRAPWVIEVEPVITPGDAAALGHPIALAMQHLADRGHERFFHIGGPDTWPTARNRRTAYAEFLRRRGLLDCGTTSGPWGAPAGYEAMASYPFDTRPTALVAASDQLALGALAWLNEHGFDVPTDVSVTGYDGIVDAAFYSPALTSVAVDFVQMGARTVQALLEGRGLEGPPDTGDYQLRAHLIERASVSNPGEGLRPVPA